MDAIHDGVGHEKFRADEEMEIRAGDAALQVAEIDRIAGAVFDADDLRKLGETLDGVGIECSSGERRNIVEEDRQGLLGGKCTNERGQFVLLERQIKR